MEAGMACIERHVPSPKKSLAIARLSVDDIAEGGSILSLNTATNRDIQLQ